MSTIFKRCFAYSKNNKVPILSVRERKFIGKQAAAAYHKAEVKKPLYRLKMQEPEGFFEVIVYPSIFSPEIDAIISNFYKSGRIVPQETFVETSESEKISKKRRRIPLNSRPIRSFSPSNRQ